MRVKLLTEHHLEFLSLKGMYNHQSLRSACTYAQSDQSLCLLLEYSMRVKLLTEHHLEFLSLKGGCKGLSVSILVKMTHCWKSHDMAQIFLTYSIFHSSQAFKINWFRVVQINNWSRIMLGEL